MKSTSWQNVSKWYGKLVGKTGQYFHDHVILPRTLDILDLNEKDTLLDLACGQGIVSRVIPKGVHYYGIDASEDLISQAEELKVNKNHRFFVSDITKPLPLKKYDFTKATIVLALQNIENIAAVFQNVNKHLRKGGQFFIVLNHPSFRIPKHSDWQIEDETQFRRVDSYLSRLKIKIDLTPGGKKPTYTWSFHYPLSYISEMLMKNNFVIEKIEEWESDKTSVGKAAGMENKAREEIPMFMGILCKKV